MDNTPFEKEFMSHYLIKIPFYSDTYRYFIGVSRFYKITLIKFTFSTLILVIYADKSVC